MMYAQLFWFPPLDQVWMYEYNSTDMAEQFVPVLGLGPAQQPSVPAAGPGSAQNPLVTAQGVGGRRHLTQGMLYGLLWYFLLHWTRLRLASSVQQGPVCN